MKSNRDKTEVATSKNLNVELILCLKKCKPSSGTKLTKEILKDTFIRLSGIGYSFNKRRTVYFLYFSRKDVLRDIKQFYGFVAKDQAASTGVSAAPHTLIKIKGMLFKLEKAHNQSGRPHILFSIKLKKEPVVAEVKDKPTDELKKLKTNLNEAFEHLNQAKFKARQILSALKTLKHNSNLKSTKEPSSNDLQNLRIENTTAGLSPTKCASNSTKLITKDGTFTVKIDADNKDANEPESCLLSPIIDGSVNWGDVEEILEQKARRKKANQTWRDKLLSKGPKLVSLGTGKGVFQRKEGATCDFEQKNRSMLHQEYQRHKKIRNKLK